MSIIIFIIILAVLILVHELGHFIVAKLSGIRVDEFGIGYPPRAATLFTWKGTKFTINWIPFGGFVKIFGENNEGQELDPNSPEARESFVRKPRLIQAAVLVAGVACNIIFAWILISGGFMVGLPTSTSAVDDPSQIRDAKLLITSVSPESPAFMSGLKSGDQITGVETGAENVPTESLTPEAVSNFISSHGDNEITISYVRGEETGSIKATPAEGIVSDKKVIGISMDTVGTLSLPVHKALWEGAQTTYNLTKLTAVGLAQFIGSAFIGQSDLSQVTGPVGIVGLVGDASKLGFIYILSFTAFISINLAVINMIPFPALDGGRLLFVIIEAIRRKPMSGKIVNIINAVGFFLLIGLMVVVTVHDVLKLF